MSDHLILDFINDTIYTNSKGLFVINAPTGYGKTYQVLKYIRENYKDKKIYFISNQEKLLPTEEKLYEGLNELEKKELFNKTIYLKSIINTFKENYFKITINYEFLDYETIEITNSLKGIIKALNSKEIDPEVSVYLVEKFYEQERKLRKKIKDYVGGKKSRITEWIKVLYPTVKLDEFNVIFMTTKKFFLPIDPIIDRSYFLYEQESHNSVVFIDEIDSTKEELLNLIIDDKGNDEIELFRLFRNVDYAITDNSIINDFPADEEGKIDYAIAYLTELREYFKSKHEYIKNVSSNDYKDKSPLKYAFKSINFNENHNFLFNDGNSITVLNKNQNKKLEYRFNDKKNRNEIVISNKKTPNNLELVFSTVLDSINYFVNKTSILVLEYKKYFEKNNRKTIEVSSIYSSIIDRMNLGEENKTYLLTSIHDFMIRGRNIIKTNIETDEIKYGRLKRDFFRRGFSYMEVVDKENHHLESKLYTYNYNKTPEQLLLTLSNNYHVIGLSATATLNSSITNYDLEYLKFNLMDSYKELSTKQIEEIREDYLRKKEKIYEDTSYEIDLIDELKKTKWPNNEFKYLESLLDESVYFEHINKINESKLGRYILDETANLYVVIEKFMQNEKMHSFLFFSNSNMNNWGSYKELILNTIKDKYENLVDIIIIDAKFYKSNNLEQRLNQKKKVFIISAYRTVGTGVNLQYALEEQTKDMKKDIDGVFLPKPTNVIPNLKQDELSRQDIARYIYYIEYSKVKDSISFTEYFKSVIYAFSRFVKLTDNKQPFKQLDNDEIGLGILKTIIQAIGRISRTESKRYHIQIFTTNDVSEYLFKYINEINSLPITMELQKLIEAISTKYSGNKKFFILNEPSYINKNTIDYINDFIKPWDWNQEKINKWNQLREFVLKYPTIDNNHSDYVNQMYYHFSEQTTLYSIDNAYRVRKISNNSSVYRMEISSFSSNLDKAMEINYVKNAFERNGYATTFGDFSFHMSPLLFTRIYKAAIGEKVGALFLQHHELILEHIDDEKLFEFFDFHYKYQVFIDFKNWNPEFKIDEYKQLRKIERKNSRAKGIYIFIINVFYEGFNDSIEYDIDNGQLFTIPWLIKDKDNFNKKALATIMEKIKIWE